MIGESVAKSYQNFLFSELDALFACEELHRVLLLPQNSMLSGSAEQWLSHWGKMMVIHSRDEVDRFHVSHSLCGAPSITLMICILSQFICWKIISGFQWFIFKICSNLLYLLDNILNPGEESNWYFLTIEFKNR